MYELEEGSTIWIKNKFVHTKHLKILRTCYRNGKRFASLWDNINNISKCMNKNGRRSKNPNSIFIYVLFFKTYLKHS